MPLEGGDDVRGARVENSVDLDAVAVEREHALQRYDRDAFFAARIGGPVADFRRCNPMADAGIGKPGPGEVLAGIELAPGRHVRMGQYPVGGDGMPPHDVAADGDERLDLGV